MRPEQLPHVPYLVKYREWINFLKDAINRQLPEEWEVSQIEEQYILYEKGGRFEPHHDTHANPFACDRKEHHYPRLLTFIIYLNPDWIPEHEGNFVIIENHRKDNETKKYVTPTMGKAAIFRADKVYHGGMEVQAPKRALSLFYNIKKKTEPLVYN